MKYFKTLFLIAIVSVLSTVTANADFGNQLFKLLPDDGSIFDRFGTTMAADNGIIAIAATGDSSAYLFNASTGRQIVKLVPGFSPGSEFGESIAFGGGIVAVGAPSYQDDRNLILGSVFLFDASTGDQIGMLLASDGNDLDYFGRSIAIDSTIVAVGAIFDDDNGFDSGSAYIFDITDPANPLQIAKLLPSDGASGNQFGSSIAIEGGVVAVGAIGADGNGSGSGSVYLFNASTGSELFKFFPIDGLGGDNFGWSIAINNGNAAVGAHRADDNGTCSGSAYIFDVSTGTQLFKLLPNDGAAFDNFGRSIDIDGSVVAVGAWMHDDNGANSGSAYLFDLSTGEQITKLLPNDGMEVDWFGMSIAIDNSIVAVGAPRDDDNDTDSGSVYLFDAAAPGKCPWDLDASGTVNTGDLLALFAQWGTAGPADFDGNGTVNTNDLLILFANWGPCP